MKKITIITVVALSLLMASCSKEETTSTTYTNGSQKNWFEFDGTRYYAQSMTTGQAGSNKLALSIKASYVDSPKHIFADATIIIFEGQVIGDSVTGVYDAYNTQSINLKNIYTVKRSNGNYFTSSPNCSKTVSVVLNQYNRLTSASGYYYLYESYDSTKRHTVKFNFTFD